MRSSLRSVVRPTILALATLFLLLLALFLPGVSAPASASQMSLASSAATATPSSTQTATFAASVTASPPSGTATPTATPTLIPGTAVSGGIFANTEWTLANSPYVVTGTVTLFPGYTLTIDPGVQVLFEDNTALIVRGQLVAVGTSSQHIIFSSADASPTTTSWLGIQIANQEGGSGSVAYADMSYAATAISVECCGSGGPLNIQNSSFTNNRVALGGNAGLITTVDNCTFSDNIYAVDNEGSSISNSTFTNNTYALWASNFNVVSSNFTGNRVAVTNGGPGTLQYSTITGNGIGVLANYINFTSSYNTIANNAVGIIVGEYYQGTSPVSENNIFGNTQYNIENQGPMNQDVSNNWWGTTDTNAIDASIYDGHDNPTLGLLNYEPILTQPVSMATSTSTPTATATPTSTASATTTPTFTPTATRTPRWTDTPTPTLTPTALISTATLTPSATITPTATLTPTAIIPTATATPSSTVTSTITLTPIGVARDVLGKGSIAGNASGTAIFAFSVARSAPASPASGSLRYVDPASSISLASTSITTLVNDGNTASFAGVGQLNGATPVEFVVLIDDASATGAGADTFGISLSTGYANDGTLTSGNVYTR